MSKRSREPWSRTRRNGTPVIAQSIQELAQSMRDFDKRSIAPIRIDARGNAMSSNSCRSRNREITSSSGLNLDGLNLEARSDMSAAAECILPSDRGTGPYDSYFPNEIWQSAIKGYVANISNRSCKPRELDRLDPEGSQEGANVATGALMRRGKRTRDNVEAPR